VRTIIVYVLLVLAAAGSWYLARERGAETETESGAPPAERGFYLRNARIFGTGENGELVYRIEAERAEQVQDERIDLSNVTLFYVPDGAVPWTVDADSASIRNDERRVLLRGHVRALNHGDETAPDTEIRTDYLELDPDSYTAETDERVQIRIGERSLTATGMLASLDTNRLELKSNVSGKFFP